MSQYADTITRAYIIRTHEGSTLHLVVALGHERLPHSLEGRATLVDVSVSPDQKPLDVGDVVRFTGSEDAPAFVKCGRL